ncbi:MAG: hypothetical protein IKF58_09195, partial [Bacillus sp. (in: Bacteria)]|nr:hypothetical protein [Bacillus sp. (in: firmicutes)]
MSEINVNLREGSFSINGSEEFIEKHMNDVFGFVEKSIGSATPPIKTTKAIEVATETTKPNANPSTNTEDRLQKYIDGGALHIDSDGNVSILGKIPGNNKSDKTRNIAMIILYVKNCPIVGNDIKPICEKHKCLDKAHFANTFDREKKYIVRGGSGRNWTIELTQPGEEKAIELLE